MDLSVPRLESPCLFRAVSPLVVSRPEPREGRRGLRKIYLSPVREPQEFCRRLAENLRKKTEEWLGVSGPVAVATGPGGRLCRVRYKGADVAGWLVPAAVSGPKEALLAAACAGLGERTGSGFGAVLLWEEARRGFVPA